MKDKDKWKIDAASENETNEPLSEENTGKISGQLSSVEEIITEPLHKNLVMFIGPRETGKTVALMRLTYFLEKNRDTKIEPNKYYRKDEPYKVSVNAFLDDLHRPNFSPKRTGNINFLVLDVYKNSELYCQFLEAPGEGFFDPNDPHNKTFPPYLIDIANDSSLNKVFIFFFEEGMLSNSDPIAYSKRLSSLVGMMDRGKDDVIILFNKSDRHRNLYYNNKPNTRQFKNLLYKNSRYSDFFGSLKSLGIPVKFVVFSSGVFHKVPDKDMERWTHSDDYYPETLWRNIDRCFKSFSLW
ncbi:MAG: hypothetical protein AAGB24_05735 [Bacteroidota bacterium]